MREGLVGFHASNPFRVEVRAVERHEELTVLRMEISTTEDTKTPGGFGYDGLPGQSVTFGRFRLLDPVGGEMYLTLREKSGERAFGTRHGDGYPEDFQPGVRYPVEVYFPPLPGGVKSVSLVPDLAMAPPPPASPSPTEPRRPWPGSAARAGNTSGRWCSPRATTGPGCPG
ncbi:hypothetical protein ACFSTC_16965 [Nonomuraea ferruginea]